VRILHCHGERVRIIIFYPLTVRLTFGGCIPILWVIENLINNRDFVMRMEF
jgi:hypothetical protein